jgi:hypothetical protein
MGLRVWGQRLVAQAASGGMNRMEHSATSNEQLVKENVLVRLAVQGALRRAQLDLAKRLGAS